MPRAKTQPSITQSDLLEAWNTWNRYSTMIIKKSSISEYSKPIRSYLRYLEQKNLSLVPMQQQELIVPAIASQIRDFVNEYQEKFNTGEKYCTIIVSALKTFYNISKNISLRGIKIPFKKDEKIRLPTVLFSEEEVNKILKMAERKLDLVEKTMIHLGYYACLRAIELVTIKPSNFIEEDNRIYLETEVRKLRKEKKMKKVEVPDYTIDWINEIIRRDGVSKNRYLFRVEPKRRFKGIRRRRYLPGEFGHWFREFVENIGIKKSDAPGLRYWHNFARHTRLTLYVKKYKPTLPELLLLSGHSEPKTCLKYFKWAEIETAEIEEMKKL